MISIIGRLCYTNVFRMVMQRPSLSPSGTRLTSQYHISSYKSIMHRLLSDQLWYIDISRNFPQYIFVKSAHLRTYPQL